MDPEEKLSLTGRVKSVLIGGARDPQDPRVFHKLTLIAFFAWVGLGSDGLSSSCYGPSEAFLALKHYPHLGIFVGLGTALTILVISISYSQIIELFPTGGGGYLVASKLLSPTVGMISGCALLIDYILTIALSIASGSEAIFSFLPPAWAPYRLEFAVFGVLVLIVLNLRGVKESVIALVPIFLVFVATHLFAIFYAIMTHADNIPQVVELTATDLRAASGQLGFFGMMLLLLRAYSMGAGTFTGIEAVSNGLPVLREPRVRTAKRTMQYMAASLIVTAGGLMIGYILFHVEPVPGKTLNAIFFERISASWPQNAAYAFVLITLVSEGAILFVAAQTGFVDGPRVLANMALDRWFPTRFANLSDRLVTQNGVLLMGGAALILMILSKGSVQLLIVLYSINVFITFVLSQAGMVRHWWNERRRDSKWKKHISINGIGLMLSSTILVSVTVVKFHEGGWITLLVTGSLVAVVTAVRRHYKKTARLLRRLNDLVAAVDSSGAVPVPTAAHGTTAPNEPDPRAATAVVLVNGYNGLGLHTLFGVFRLFKGAFKNFIMVQVGVVDAGTFKGKTEIDRLQEHVQNDLDHYVRFLKRHGYYAEPVAALAVDVVDEIETIGDSLVKKYPGAVFFGGQLVFKKETLFTGLLHNHVVFAVQRRLYHRGIPFIILPIRL